MDDAVGNITQNLASLSDRQGFDRRWFAGNESLSIYRPTSRREATEMIAEIASLVRSGQIAGNQVQIASGRHCYEGFVYNDNTTHIIDVTGLRGYGTLELENLTLAYIDTGYGNWDMYRIMANVFGRTLPAGSCYSVGLGGHITGGGYGILSRLHGLTIDHIYAFDVVVADENSGAASLFVFRESEKKENADLFWALAGGGGGQSALITRIYFNLDNPSICRTMPTCPEGMAFTTFSWDWKDSAGEIAISQTQFNGILKTYYDIFCDQDPDTWNTWAMFHATHCDTGTLTCPVIIYQPDGMSGSDFKTYCQAKVDTWTSQFNAAAPLSKADHGFVGAPFLRSRRTMGISAPGVDEPNIRYYSYLDGTQELNGSGENRFGKYKSAYHTDFFDTEMLSAMYTALSTEVDGLDLSNALIQMDSYGGAINTKPDGTPYQRYDTPVPQRSSTIKLQYQVYWYSLATDNYYPGDTLPAKSSTYISWINDMYSSIYAATGGVPLNQDSTEQDITTDGCYFNYPDIELGTNETGEVEQAWDLYFGQNVERMQEVTALWNPLAMFTNSQTLQYPSQT